MCTERSGVGWRMIDREMISNNNTGEHSEGKFQLRSSDCGIMVKEDAT